MYNIRPMYSDDIDQVEKIEQAVFSVPWSAKSFADACSNPDNVYLVCDIDGIIAGYCGQFLARGILPIWLFHRITEEKELQRLL